ncbi:MAG: hypothetical protein ACI4OW_02340 [Alphaproteobacteria bacterium]
MVKYWAYAAIAGILCLWAYTLGKQECETGQIIKEKKEMEYVVKEKSKIYARPNAGRDKLLKLMYDGML